MSEESGHPVLKYALGFLVGAFLIGLIWVITLFSKPPSIAPSVEWGKFSGNPKTEWLPDGRTMKVLEDFTYTDSRNKVWVAPKDWVVDGASIPKAFWSIIGGPLEGSYRNASICHDVGCDRKEFPWADVHRMFYEGCRCGGLDEKPAKIMYAAVYFFGPRWELTMQSQPKEVIGPKGKKMMMTTTARVAVPTHVTQQPSEEVKANLEKYINEKNPSLEQIEKLDPKEFGVPVPE